MAAAGEGWCHDLHADTRPVPPPLGLIGTLPLAMASPLDVDLAGRRARFDPPTDQPVRFGRAPDLELVVPDASGGADLHMSRHVGSFRFRDGTWTLENPSPRSPGKKRAVLDVVTLTGSTTAVPPGASTPLPGVGEVRWRTTSTTTYSLRFRFAGVTAAAVRSAEAPAGPATSEVVLTPREVDFCVSLAEPELFGSLRARRLSLPEVAERWYVSLGTVEKTLRGLRDKLVAAGMVDFDDDQKVRDKTARLVAAVVELGFLGLDDWRWAHPAEGGPLRSSEHGPRFAPEAAS